MLRPLAGEERPGDAALSAAAIRLIQDKLRAEGGEVLRLKIPEALRARAEDELSRLRRSWPE
jgi:hypothetical protein